MNWIETVVSIKDILTKHGFDETVNKITQAQMTFGTPGEMYLEVMQVLLNLKKEATTEYILVQKEIGELLAYGKSINYFNPEE